MISVDSSNLRKLSDMHKAACYMPPYAQKTDTEIYKAKEKKEKRTNYGRKEF